MDFTRRHRDGSPPQPDLYMQALNNATFLFNDGQGPYTNVEVWIGDAGPTDQSRAVVNQLALSLNVNAAAVKLVLDSSGVQVLPDPGGGWLIEATVTPDPPPDQGQEYDSESIAGLGDTNPVALRGLFPNRDA